MMSARLLRPAVRAAAASGLFAPSSHLLRVPRTMKQPKVFASPAVGRVFVKTPVVWNLASSGVANACSSCARDVVPGANFCAFCGTKVVVVAQPVQVQVQQASPEPCTTTTAPATVTTAVEQAPTTVEETSTPSTSEEAPVQQDVPREEQAVAVEQKEDAGKVAQAAKASPRSPVMREMARLLDVWQVPVYMTLPQLCEAGLTEEDAQRVISYIRNVAAEGENPHYELARFFNAFARKAYQEAKQQQEAEKRALAAKKEATEIASAQPVKVEELPNGGVRRFYRYGPNSWGYVEEWPARQQQAAKDDAKPQGEAKVQANADQGSKEATAESTKETKEPAAEGTASLPSSSFHHAHPFLTFPAPPIFGLASAMFPAQRHFVRSPLGWW